MRARAASASSSASTIASRQRSAPALESWSTTRVAVAVDHHARQAVRFAMHEAHGIGGAIVQQIRALLHRSFDARAKKAASMARFVKSQTRATICDCGL